MFPISHDPGAVGRGGDSDHGYGLPWYAKALPRRSHHIDRSGVLKLEGQVVPEMVSQRTLVGVMQPLSSHCAINDRGRLTYEDVFQLGLGARQSSEPLDELMQSCRRLQQGSPAYVSESYT